MAEPATSASNPPIFHGGPEALFRLHDLGPEGSGVVGRAHSGPWTHGLDGRTALGSLGVLLDDVLGYAIIAHRPVDHWSVSLEITLDLVAPLPSDGTVLTARAQVVHTDAEGGFATGTVLDPDGRLLAVGTQRGRYVPAPSLDLSGPHADLHLDAVDMARLVGAVAHPDGLVLTVDPAVQNPMRNLHGGISISLSELAAASALQRAGSDLQVTSLRVQYPRPVPGGAVVTFATEVRHLGRSLAVLDVTGEVVGKAGTVARLTATRPLLP